MAATGSFLRDGFEAVGAVFGRWIGGGGVFFALELVELTDDEEDRKGDDQEVQHVVDEQAVVDRRRTCRFGLGKGGVGGRRQVDVEVGKIDPAQQQPNRRHEDVVGEGGDDFAKCGTDHDTDG